MSSNNNDIDVRHVADRHRRDVGILSIAAYFPKTYVGQTDLEAYDKVDTGKYTKGLMQDKMAFCTDLEDINSISLTVLKKLIDASNVRLEDIGYLEVGTETLVDKSKSVKTVLMDLFADVNTDIEGVDTTNACYGGTAALFHAIDYCLSPFWDGRLAVVIAADIAVYDKGNARPTGGCGAIAMLIGPNAPLVLDPFRASHMSNTYDFYKPDPLSEYPTVDGKLSLHAYISALDKCYTAYRNKFLKNASLDSAAFGDKGQQQVSLIDEFDAILMHSPYCKLVRKSFARLLYNEHLVASNEVESNNSIADRYKGFELFDGIKQSDSIDNRDIEKVAVQLSEELYQQKTLPSLLLSNQIGNMYTASLYSCLVSYLISKPIECLAGKKLLFFSYGSGSAASMFSGRVTDNVDAIGKLTNAIQDVKQLLQQRIKVTPEEFTAHLEHRKRTFTLPSREPTGEPTAADAGQYQKVVPIASPKAYLWPGTFYLTSVDSLFRRKYMRTEPAVTEANNNNNNNSNEASAIVRSKANNILIQQQQQQQQQHQQVV